MPPVHPLWSCLIGLGACAPELRSLVNGGGIDVVILKLANVEFIVGSAEVQLRTVGVEFEPENTLGDSLLLDGGVEERTLRSEDQRTLCAINQILPG